MGQTTFEFEAPVVEMDLIDLAARVAGMSVGEFLLQSAARRAQEVLLNGPLVVAPEAAAAPPAPA